MGRPENLKLYALIIDPDQKKKGDLSGVQYEWLCETAENGLPCFVDEYAFTPSLLTQIIPANILVAHSTYIFSIAAMKGDGVLSQKIKASASILVQENAQSSISVNYPARFSA